MKRGTSQLVSSVILVVVLNVAALGTVTFMFRLIAAERANLAQVAGAAETTVELDAHGSTLRHSLASTAQSRSRLDTYFIDQSSAGDALASLESLARAAGATLAVDSVRVEPAGGKSKALRIESSAKGDFENLFHLLTLMELLPGAVSLDQADIFIVPKVGNTAAHWEGKFSLHIFSFIDKES